MLAVWNMIGGLAGILRVLIGASLTFAYMWLFVIPGQRQDARNGYVLETRAVAAEAQLKEVQRQLNANQIVIDAYQQQYKNALATIEQQDKQDEAAIKANEEDNKVKGRSRTLDDADIDFLRK